MPCILSPNDYCNNDTTNFEKFNLIVENYKHVIENDATARCMIGFTAASLIRNEGDIDIDSVESWLQSIESNVEQQVSSFKEVQEDQHHHNRINRILRVVKRTAADYYDQEHNIEEVYDEDSTTDSEDIEDEDSECVVVENEAAYELNRFVSRNPYSSTESYPTYSYLLKHTIVNYSSYVDHLFFPLEEFTKTLS